MINHKKKKDWIKIGSYYELKEDDVSKDPNGFTHTHTHKAKLVYIDTYFVVLSCTKYIQQSIDRGMNEDAHVDHIRLIASNLHLISIKEVFPKNFNLVLIFQRIVVKNGIAFMGVINQIIPPKQSSL